MSDTTWRFENKIVISNLAEEKSLNHIFLSPAFFKPMFPERQINNLYLDTPDLECFRNHTASLGSRFKARLRWYGEFKTPRHVKLEIKIRSGEVGTKYIYDFPDNLNLKEIRNLELPDSFKENLLVMQPALFNYYQREYYTSTPAGIRLTVDKNIFYKSVHSKAWLNEQKDLKILELKYDVSDAKRGNEILKSFTDRKEKSSKYVRGTLRTVDI